MRRELGKGWIQSLRTELERAVQRLLGEDWKEEAEKYLLKLEEEEREQTCAKIQGKKKESQKRT